MKQCGDQGRSPKRRDNERPDLAEFLKTVIREVPYSLQRALV
jgi:hypothetical protein